MGVEAVLPTNTPTAADITGPIPHILQAVLERPVPEVAALPVQELRLALLAPSELATLESHNQRDLLIPVSCCLPPGVPRLTPAAGGCCRAGGIHAVAVLMPLSLTPQMESIAAAWRSHALRKGSGVPSRLCRPRRGTRPRDHHRHLDPHTK